MILSPQLDIQADIDAISRISIIPKILEVICRNTGMGFAAVARVTENKWVACAVRDEIAFGLQPGGELVLETTICHEISQSGNAVVIDHVAENDVFRNHHTPAMYGFQSYISMPIIRKDGTFFGTLCAIDPRPAKLNTPETVGMFSLYADLISFHLNAVDQLVFAEQRLQEERKTAELRDQFIAILGHDLRNPISAISNSAQLLMRMATDDRSVRVANIINDSSYRMRELIENVLDFARGRLGEGITLNLKANDKLEKILTQIITELQVIFPDRVIETSFDLTETVTCDAERIAQLFSNILGNALKHGQKDTTVIVNVHSANSQFGLSVANQGKQIPGELMQRLFQPFHRGEVLPGQQGLGLGLYIASEIANAHGGKLDVVSTAEETVFTLTMPACS